MHQAVLWSLAVSCMLISTTTAATERSWEFSIGGYGGWAFMAIQHFKPIN